MTRAVRDPSRRCPAAAGCWNTAPKHAGAPPRRRLRRAEATRRPGSRSGQKRDCGDTRAAGQSGLGAPGQGGRLLLRIGAGRLRPGSCGPDAPWVTPDLGDIVAIPRRVGRPGLPAGPGTAPPACPGFYPTANRATSTDTRAAGASRTPLRPSRRRDARGLSPSVSPLTGRVTTTCHTSSAAAAIWSSAGQRTGPRVCRSSMPALPPESQQRTDAHLAVAHRPELSGRLWGECQPVQAVPPRSPCLL